ncbi:MAG: hypothetical protein AAGK28_09525 [Pseudomonadota bacterium]
MSAQYAKRGGAPVGLVANLPKVEAACVRYLRLWSMGVDGQSEVWNAFAAGLGGVQGKQAMRTFEELHTICCRHGRRPLMRHAINCKCLGADESCFANFIATAAEGEMEDAMLIATLIVRADMAPVIAALASDLGLALKRMPPDLSSVAMHTHQTHTVH